MKFISFILAINLLTSSLHVCLGNVGCEASSKIKVEQLDVKKHSCCKGKSEENKSNDENPPCQEGCACCFVMPVVISDTDTENDLHPSVFHRQNSWVTNHYSHHFTHLIWHPPQTIL